MAQRERRVQGASGVRVVYLRFGIVFPRRGGAIGRAAGQPASPPSAPAHHRFASCFENLEGALRHLLAIEPGGRR